MQRDEEMEKNHDMNGKKSITCNNYVRWEEKGTGRRKNNNVVKNVWAKIQPVIGANVLVFKIHNLCTKKINSIKSLFTTVQHTNLKKVETVFLMSNVQLSIDDIIAHIILLKTAHTHSGGAITGRTRWLKFPLKFHSQAIQIWMVKKLVQNYHFVSSI